ncbi:dCTP deaminase [Candidatus Pacearchaeota archaeon]|nr:dCTP deaminase [Candidatus Pacearchaeota archaeon]
MILTHDEILRQIKKGRIKIEPFNPLNIGPASIDLHLNNEFRIFRDIKKPIDLSEDTNYENISNVVKTRDKIIIKPGHAVLGMTQEKITLPENICGRLEGRSRFARLGLQIHTTAGFIQPGVSNKQVLEIGNISSIPLAIRPGLKICQLVFEECKGNAKYEGEFKEQESP